MTEQQQEEGKLTKLRIEAYEDIECNNKAQDIPFFDAMMNPENYTLETKMEFQPAVAQAQGTTASPARFVIKPPEELTFELLFDNTGIINSQTDRGKQKIIVADELARLKDFLMKYNGDIHRPKFFKLIWGTQLVKGVCTSLSIAYKLFNPDGAPIRAICKITIREVKSDERQVLEKETKSPDLTHYRTVKQGDTLPLMCYSIYGNSKYYLEVAKANGLGNFRSLQPGDEIFFPPFAKS